MASLRTATSTANMQWLDENAKQIEARRADGKMNAEVYAAIKAIIDKAKAGDWKEADADAFALLQAQKPAIANDADNPDHTHKHGPQCAGHAH